MMKGEEGRVHFLITWRLSVQIIPLDRDWPRREWKGAKSFDPIRHSCRRRKWPHNNNTIIIIINVCTHPADRKYLHTVHVKALKRNKEIIGKVIDIMYLYIVYIVISEDYIFVQLTSKRRAIKIVKYSETCKIHFWSIRNYITTHFSVEIL